MPEADFSDGCWKWHLRVNAELGNSRAHLYNGGTFPFIQALF